MWKNLDKSYPHSVHYSVLQLEDPNNGMGALRAMFPEAKANLMNFVLFSTSGVHGTYNTIEEAEKVINNPNAKDDYGDPLDDEITFVIVHPRLVAMRYGNCRPKNQSDIDFLKELRESSRRAVNDIG